jgi:hypothetical protein
VLLVAACGTTPSDTPGIDGPPPAGLSVRVTSPNGNEGFYQADTVSVMWIPHDDIPGDITCDVEARGATTIAIAQDLSTTSDQTATTTWMPVGVAPGSYRVAVTCTDTMARTASDESDAVFAITPPPRAVSFAGELQPILVASCLGAPCHDAAQPAAGLSLTDGPTSYGEMVDVASQQCGTIKLVDPGSPSNSYLIHKLVGSNPGGCFTGTKMPKVDQSLPTDEIQAFRDWIANGAPDN